MYFSYLSVEKHYWIQAESAVAQVFQQGDQQHDSTVLPWVSLLSEQSPIHIYFQNLPLTPIHKYTSKIYLLIVKFFSWSSYGSNPFIFAYFNP